MPVLGSILLSMLAAVRGLPASLPQGTWYPAMEDGSHNRCRDLRSPHDSLKLQDGFIVFYSSKSTSASPITRVAGDSLFVHDRERGALCLVIEDRVAVLVGESLGGERVAVEYLRKKIARRSVDCD